MSHSIRLIDVFVTHRAQLKRAAHDILGHHESAEDLLHDACVKALGMADERLLEPVAYAFRMIRNMAIDRYRRGGLEMRLFADEDAGGQVPDERDTPESIAIKRQQLGTVHRVLAALPERTRSVFEMHRLDGCTQREIAERIGVSPPMVHFMLRDVVERCREALR